MYTYIWRDVRTGTEGLTPVGLYSNIPRPLDTVLCLKCIVSDMLCFSVCLEGGICCIYGHCSLSRILHVRVVLPVLLSGSPVYLKLLSCLIFALL